MPRGPSPGSLPFIPAMISVSSPVRDRLAAPSGPLRLRLIKAHFRFCNQDHDTIRLSPLFPTSSVYPVARESLCREVTCPLSLSVTVRIIFLLSMFPSSRRFFLLNRSLRDRTLSSFRFCLPPPTNKWTPLFMNSSSLPSPPLFTPDCECQRTVFFCYLF